MQGVLQNFWFAPRSISPISGKELSAATVKHTYHVLSEALDKAVSAGIFVRSPCAGIILPKGRKKPAVIYDEEQTRQLIRTSRGTCMELVIDIELCLGLRRGELLGLQWSDIDWEKKQVTISRNRVLAGSEMVVKEPKTEAGTRTIDVPAQLIEKLRKHKIACAENRLKYGADYFSSDYVIVHPDGQPVYPEYLSQLLTKLQKRAGLPKCRFHDLRHLCATLMIKQGVNVKVVQKILGHADVSTTLNIYAHALPSSMKDAADRMAAAIYADAG